MYLLRSTALVVRLLGRASVDESRARKTMANVANRERMEEAMSIYDDGLIMYEEEKNQNAEIDDAELGGDAGWRGWSKNEERRKCSYL